MRRGASVRSTSSSTRRASTARRRSSSIGPRGVASRPRHEPDLGLHRLPGLRSGDGRPWPGRDDHQLLVRLLGDPAVARPHLLGLEGGDQHPDPLSRPRAGAPSDPRQRHRARGSSRPSRTASCSTRAGVEAILRHTPAGRLGEADELVGTMIWLASERASGFVTGALDPRRRRLQRDDDLRATWRDGQAGRPGDERADRAGPHSVVDADDRHSGRARTRASPAARSSRRTRRRSRRWSDRR